MSSIYEEAEFDHLTKEDYNCFSRILDKDDEKLNSLMDDAFQIIWEYAYCDITDRGSQNYHYLEDAQEIMKSSSLALPSIEKVSFSKSSESDGWGDLIDPKGISTVL